jgi:c-di-GMP-related signal transduction protein
VESSIPYVSRQPVYDRVGSCAGYELSFRGPGTIIADTLADLGGADPVGDKLWLITAVHEVGTAGSGRDGLPREPGPEIDSLAPGDTYPRVVRMSVDASTDAVAAVAGRGLAVAVSATAADPLLALASYATVELHTTAPDRVRAAVDTCRAHRHLRIVALGLSTRAHLAQARRLGCDLLQGPALWQPRPMSPARFRHIDLMAAALTGDPVDLGRIIARDPALSFRLLRAATAATVASAAAAATAASAPSAASGAAVASASSAAAGSSAWSALSGPAVPAAAAVARPPSSIAELLGSLGPERARQWLAMMLINDATDADAAQLEAVVAAARFTQRVAEHLGMAGEPAFTAGMVRALAELIGTPVADLSDGLALSAEVRAAVRSGGGRLGTVLDLVDAYGAADLPALRAGPVPPRDLVRLYLRAAAWAARTVTAVSVASGRASRATA